MATKPTDRILDWANAGSTTDPGASKENTGWVVSERPPASWWNWILNSFGQWLTYFSETTNVVGAKVNTTLGSTTGATTANSYGVSAVASSNDATGLVTLTLSTAMASADYIVQVTTGNASPHRHIVSQIGTGFIVVSVRDADDASAINLSGASTEFFVTAIEP